MWRFCVHPLCGDSVSILAVCAERKKRLQSEPKYDGQKCARKAYRMFHQGPNRRARKSLPATEDATQAHGCLWAQQQLAGSPTQQPAHRLSRNRISSSSPLPLLETIAEEAAPSPRAVGALGPLGGKLPVLLTAFNAEDDFGDGFDRDGKLDLCKITI